MVDESSNYRDRLPNFFSRGIHSYHVHPSVVCYALNAMHVIVTFTITPHHGQSWSHALSSSIKYYAARYHGLSLDSIAAIEDV